MMNGDDSLNFVELWNSCKFRQQIPFKPLRNLPTKLGSKWWMSDREAALDRPPLSARE